MSGAIAAIDRATLDELRTSVGDDPEFLRELVDTYLDDAPGQLAAMRQGISAADMAPVHRAAHTLKSNSASVGALTLAEMSRELELLAGAAVTHDREIDPGSLTTRVDELATELDRAKLELDELVPQVAR